jgi:hypothetical protein
MTSIAWNSTGRTSAGRPCGHGVGVKVWYATTALVFTDVTLAGTDLGAIDEYQ